MEYQPQKHIHSKQRAAQNVEQDLDPLLVRIIDDTRKEVADGQGSAQMDVNDSVHVTWRE